jgi:hypothetical protein
MCEGGASMEQECLTLCGKHESNEVVSLTRTRLSLLFISLQKTATPTATNSRRVEGLKQKSDQQHDENENTDVFRRQEQAEHE